MAADKKITEFDFANPLAAGELLEVVQGGVNKKASLNQLKTFISGYLQAVSERNSSGGYVGLSGFKIILKNTGGTITSLIGSSATTARNYNFKDEDGTVAFMSDIYDVIDLFSDEVVPYVTLTEDSSNVYSGSLSGFTLVEGIALKVKFPSTNSSSITINIQSSGDIDVTKNVSDSLSSGDTQNGGIYIIVYDGTNWQIFGLVTTGGGGGGGDSNVIEVVVSEDISAYDVVTADGFIADSSSVNDRNRIVGIASSFIANGFSGNVVASGKITNGSWGWTRGDKIFLNGTSLSTTPPSTGFTQIIGVAYASDTINVQIHQGILF